MEAGERDEVAAELSALGLYVDPNMWLETRSIATHSLGPSQGWLECDPAGLHLYSSFVPGVKKTFIVPAAGSSFMRRAQELSQFDNRVSRSSHSDHAIL